MKAVLLDGSRGPNDPPASVCDQVEELVRQAGYTVGRWDLDSVKLAYCQGCFRCWVKTPGKCRTRDEGAAIAEALINSDLAVFFSPITFGGYSSPLKGALDKLICLLSPGFEVADGETRHRPRYSRYPALVGVGWLPSVSADDKQASVFMRLVEHNAINLHAPSHGTAIIHGTELHAKRLGALFDEVRVG